MPALLQEKGREQCLVFCICDDIVVAEANGQVFDLEWFKRERLGDESLRASPGWKDHKRPGHEIPDRNCGFPAAAAAASNDRTCHNLSSKHLALIDPAPDRFSLRANGGDTLEGPTCYSSSLRNTEAKSSSLDCFPSCLNGGAHAQGTACNVSPLRATRTKTSAWLEPTLKHPKREIPDPNSSFPGACSGNDGTGPPNI